MTIMSRIFLSFFQNILQYLKKRCAFSQKKNITAQSAPQCPSFSLLMLLYLLLLFCRSFLPVRAANAKKCDKGDYCYNNQHEDSAHIRTTCVIQLSGNRRCE